MTRVQEAFGVVIFAVTGLALVIGLVTLGMRARAYDQIGRGGLSLNDGTDRPAREPGAGGAAASAERDAEIRQMLGARNERRVRKGEAPLDIDAEIARLSVPEIDPALEDEIRQLVIARNERRERRGKAALDVEAEVRREISELSG